MERCGRSVGATSARRSCLFIFYFFAGSVKKGNLEKTLVLVLLVSSLETFLFLIFLTI
jgi:hypothetical protein